MAVRISRAERQLRTREEIVAAAERLFVAQGFHATSLEHVAAAAGYTKGAVYSNFDGKDDLFLAVYAAHVERVVAHLERELRVAGGAGEALEALALAAGDRREREDGWLAVLVEFWAHVVRRPALRERFAQIHARAHAPFVAALEADAARRGYELPDDPRRLTAAMLAMVTGLGLERLVRPELVDARLGARMARLLLDDVRAR